MSPFSSCFPQSANRYLESAKFLSRWKYSVMRRTLSRTPPLTVWSDLQVLPLDGRVGLKDAGHQFGRHVVVDAAVAAARHQFDVGLWWKMNYLKQFFKTIMDSRSAHQKIGRQTHILLAVLRHPMLPEKWCHVLCQQLLAADHLRLNSFYQGMSTS